MSLVCRQNLKILNMKTCSFINFFWLIACVFCLVSCDEESDLISGPTTSSTMISGVARSADGVALAGVKVSLDYKESAWLGQQTTRHKAEGMTDNEGNYRLYFELRDDELRDNGNDASVARSFYLTFDLSSLPEDKYIMPKDIKSDNNGQKLYFYYNNSHFERGKYYIHNLYVPRKRWIDVTVVSDGKINANDKFVVSNLINYGGDELPFNSYYRDGRVLMDYPITMTSDREQTFRVPCALNDSNMIYIGCMKGGVGSYDAVTPVKKVFVTESEPQSVRLEIGAAE